ncbi:annulin-like [Arctopsyche grandis]|uniref:annulin-like n=1 Tax=Arctopsyche grandis TaxID=121162 RepID=UPI00406D9675
MATFANRILSLIAPRRSTRAVGYTRPQSLSSNMLITKSIDYRISENGRNHHTSKFDLMCRSDNPCLVVRRGQEFTIDLIFNRSFRMDKDVIDLVFKAEELIPSGNHNINLKKFVKVQFNTNDDTSQWTAVFVGQADNCVSLKVRSTSNSYIGKWMIEVQTSLKNDDEMPNVHYIPFYLLFNPWCELDDVYLEGDEKRNEYVLRDTGCIYRGTEEEIETKDWNYSQYHENILDCALYLITHVQKVKTPDRNSAVHIARAFSSAINSNDNKGVLIGCWDGEYEKGTSPLIWMGSREILQQYYKNRTSVMYGQCWVFAGVLTTVLRAVGIPCRPVTNYGSAHDTNADMIIETNIDEKDEKIGVSADKIWTYHVWNEIWTKRPDLSARGDYDGWQAIDATPQEKSEYKLFQCGPAPLVAIKQKELQISYDVEFIFSEVNAMEAILRDLGVGHKAPTFIRETYDSIGKEVVTKHLGKNMPEYITSSYKYDNETSATGVAQAQGFTTQELCVTLPLEIQQRVTQEIIQESAQEAAQGSAQESAEVSAQESTQESAQEFTKGGAQKVTKEKIEAPETASSVTFADDLVRPKFAGMVVCEKLDEIKFEFVRSPVVEYGQNLKVLLIIQNVSLEREHRISGSIKLKSVMYTGKVLNLIKGGGFYHVIDKSSKQEISLDVPFNEYYKLLDHQGHFKVFCTAKALDTNFIHHEEVSLRLRKPTIKISLLGTPTTGNEIELTFELRNKLMIPLTNGEFRIEGNLLKTQILRKIKRGVQPDQCATTTIKIIPPYPGEHYVSVQFMSKELQDVNGHLNFTAN